jgi:hypothetical protein
MGASSTQQASHPVDAGQDEDNFCDAIRREGPNVYSSHPYDTTARDLRIAGNGFADVARAG